MSRPRPSVFLRRRRGPAAAAAALFLGTSVGGCYTYVPPEPPGPVAGQEVRVELADAARDRIRASRALDLETLEGVWVDGAEGEVAVRVELDANRLGFGSRDFVDTLRVPRSEVRGVEVKAVSTSRSLLAAGLGVAAVVGVYAAFGGGEGGPGGDDPGEQIILVPIARVLDALGGLLR